MDYLEINPMLGSMDAPTPQHKIPSRDSTIKPRRMSSTPQELDLWDLDELSLKDQMPLSNDKDHCNFIILDQAHQRCFVCVGKEFDKEQMSKVFKPNRPVRPLKQHSTKDDDIGELGELDDFDEPEGVRVEFESAPEVALERVETRVPRQELGDDMGELEAPAQAFEPALVPEKFKAMEAEEPEKKRTSRKQNQKRGLKLYEFVGLVIFLVMGLLATGAFYYFTIGRVPKNSLFAKDVQLPVRGEYVTFTGLETYWKAVLPDQLETLAVRRNTVMMPIVAIKHEQGRGVLRFKFWDERQNMVGDLVSKEVVGDGLVEVHATAGFSQSGDFSAYRAGLTKQWKVEIWEGPSLSADSSQFKKIVETKISTEYR